MSIRMISICWIASSPSHMCTSSNILLRQLGSICLLCMASKNVWWSSQLLCSKLSFNGWPVIPPGSRKLVYWKIFGALNLEGWLVSKIICTRKLQIQTFVDGKVSRCMLYICTVHTYIQHTCIHTYMYMYLQLYIFTSPISILFICSHQKAQHLLHQTCKRLHWWWSGSWQSFAQSAYEQTPEEEAKKGRTESKFGKKNTCLLSRSTCTIVLLKLRMGQVHNGRPYIRYRSSFQKNEAEVLK